MRWLDGITHLIYVTLSELRELVIDREAWCAVIHGVAKSWTQLINWTELMYDPINIFLISGGLFSVRYFPGVSDSKSVCLQCGRPGFSPWVRKISWRRKWQSTPVFLPGKSHGQRSLVGYSPWGCKRVGHDWATNTHGWLQVKWMYIAIFCILLCGVTQNDGFSLEELAYLGIQEVIRCALLLLGLGTYWFNTVYVFTVYIYWTRKMDQAHWLRKPI